MAFQGRSGISSGCRRPYGFADVVVSVRPREVAKNEFGGASASRVSSDEIVVSLFENISAKGFWNEKLAGVEDEIVLQREVGFFAFKTFAPFGILTMKVWRVET